MYRSRIGQFYSNRKRVRIQYNRKTYRKSKGRGKQSFISLILILYLISLHSTCPSTSTKPTSWPAPRPWTAPYLNQDCLPHPVNHNFLARYRYGNRGQKKGGINIIHWNKGASLLANKMSDLSTIIDNYKPLVLGILEANFRKNDDIEDVQLPDYKMYTSPTIDNPDHGVSRVVVYTHKSLIVKPRPDLMNPWLSTIWLEVGLPRHKKFLICNAYREWGYPNQVNMESRSFRAQQERWTKFLDTWQKAIDEDKEIIVVGDLNLCHMKWNQPDLPKTSLTHKLLPLRNELFDRIVPEGFCQLVTGHSFIRQGQEKSGLDHLYSNKVNKLSAVALHTNAGSDHKMVHVTRYSKSISKNVRYVKKRVFKNFDTEGFKADIKLIRWWPVVYSCDNASIAADNLNQELSKVLDKWAPIKKV